MKISMIHFHHWDVNTAIHDQAVMNSAIILILCAIFFIFSTIMGEATIVLLLAVLGPEAAILVWYGDECM